MRFEPWFLFIPFVAVIAPPVGAVLFTVALFRLTGGFEGHMERKQTRQWKRAHKARMKARAECEVAA